MIGLRQKLKHVPGARPVVRFGRVLWRHARTKYLNLRHPTGGYVTCHGVDVFCNFKNSTYEWYDGRAPNLLADQRVIRWLLERVDGDLFLDIGAHFGFFTAFLSQLLSDRGVPASLIALEPDVENFHCLQQTMAHLNHPLVERELLQAALGEASGSLRLFKSKATCLHTYAEHDDEPCYEVPAMSLDDVVHKYGKKRKVGFIKIDIDGPEPLLFRSGRRVLEEHRPIILMEFCPVMLRAFGQNPREFFQFLCGEYHVYWVNNQGRLRQSA